MIHKATGVRFSIFSSSDLNGLLDAAKALATADALLAIEGPNEPNNFPITYRNRKGGGIDGTWVPVAELQRDMYQAAKADPILRRYPVFGPSETGAEVDNVGLQFLRIPETANTVLPGFTGVGNRGRV